MDRQFYAMLSRMKYINRWALMRNTREENICEHSHEVAVLAHALALLHNRRFGGHADPGRCVLLALYHDAPEILTGDLPTPVKLRPDYAGLLKDDGTAAEERRLVKAADKLSALIKCVEELRQGNREFAQARLSTERAVRAMGLSAANCFLDEFLPAYELTLDEQGR